MQHQDSQYKKLCSLAPLDHLKNLSSFLLFNTVNFNSLVRHFVHVKQRKGKKNS